MIPLSTITNSPPLLTLHCYKCSKLIQTEIHCINQNEYKLQSQNNVKIIVSPIVQIGNQLNFIIMCPDCRF
jgi:hypothetical protein